MVNNIVLRTPVKGTYLQSISLIKEFFAISKSSSESLNIKSVNLPAGLEKINRKHFVAIPYIVQEIRDNVSENDTI